MIIYERPRKAHFSLLTIFTAIFLTQLVVLSHSEDRLRAQDLPLFLALVVALVGIITILNMPMRDPNMPNDDISQVYSTPTAKLRTPEDNLTPWQCMIVAWMGPLLRVGSQQQLNDENTWDLPWEFKHARLHDTFRKLPGSVTRRLFGANAIDLIRTCVLTLIHLALCKSTSQAMEPISELTSSSSIGICSPSTFAGVYE